MLTFNPGPSQLSDETKADITQAAKSDLLSMSHRSPQFSEISRQAVEGLRTYFSLPTNYHVVYTASATEAMAMTIENTTERASFHFTCGNFSEYFARISRGLGKDAHEGAVDWGLKNDYSIPVGPDIETITITHNETSTGVMCGEADIGLVRRKYPDKLLAVDSTSLAGVAKVDFSLADIWLFSVQKCFGLPAGLGIFIYSDRVLERSKLLLSQKKLFPGAFPLPKMHDKMTEKYQTIATPNVLGIYLLAQQITRWNDRGGIEVIQKETEDKKAFLEYFVAGHPDFDFFVSDPAARSSSVVTVKAAEDLLQKIHERCSEADIVMGKGYGKLKPSTFRIANFPALKMSDMERLVSVI